MRGERKKTTTMVKLNSEYDVAKVEKMLMMMEPFCITSTNTKYEQKLTPSGPAETEREQVNASNYSISSIGEAPKIHETFNDMDLMTELASQDIIQSKLHGELTITSNTQDGVDKATIDANLDQTLDTDPSLVTLVLRIIDAPVKSQGLFHACVTPFKCAQNDWEGSRNKFQEMMYRKLFCKYEEMMYRKVFLGPATALNQELKTTFEPYVPKTIMVEPQNFRCKNGMVTWEEIIKSITRKEERTVASIHDQSSFSDPSMVLG